MLAARSILIVENNDRVRQGLIGLLTSTGRSQPTAVSTLSDASRHLQWADARFDLIILAVELPDGDGPNFCARLREQGHRMPIVTVAETANDYDVVRALDSGATDCIVLPFRPAELLARLRAAVRSHDYSAYAVFTIGPWTFSPEQRQLTRRDGSRSVHLGGKEVSLLKYFCRAGDCAISSQALLNDVWGYHAAVRTHTLETHVYRLRQNLEFDPKSPLFLVTAPGGYRLNKARVARQGELCRTCDVDKKQAADWCVPSPGAQCRALAMA